MTIINNPRTFRNTEAERVQIRIIDQLDLGNREGMTEQELAEELGIESALVHDSISGLLNSGAITQIHRSSADLIQEQGEEAFKILR